MQIDRRKFLESASAAALLPVLAHSLEAGPSPEAKPMYGLIAKLTLLPGKRDEMIAILKEATAALPGCLSYVVAKDCSGENIIWVTEIWDSLASHDASLALPAVKNAITRAQPLIAGFEKVAVTTPIVGVALPTAHSS
ncbi:MAG: putative quinol monooxygenase [Candidatus Acidiferrum sp.]